MAMICEFSFPEMMVLVGDYRLAQIHKKREPSVFAAMAVSPKQ
jgi:hypothetical protein